MSVSCSICMVDYGEDGNNSEVFAIKCGHLFHAECLTAWRISSRKLECPECRQRYTARTLNKVYLNILPKDPDSQKNLNEILNAHERQTDELKRQKLQSDISLARTQASLLAVTMSSQELEKMHADECLENALLKHKVDRLTQELERVKAEALRELRRKEEKRRMKNLEQAAALARLKTESEKLNVLVENPIEPLKEAEKRLHDGEIANTKRPQTSESSVVDLTKEIIDDDSDIELVQSECSPSKRKRRGFKPAEVIALSDEETSEVIELSQTTTDAGQSEPSDLNLSNKQRTECFEDLGQFLRDAIGMSSFN